MRSSTAQFAGGEVTCERRSSRSYRRAFYDDQRLVAEVNGHGSHATRRQRQADAEAVPARLAAMGLRVVDFTYEDVEQRPSHVGHPSRAARADSVDRFRERLATITVDNRSRNPRAPARERLNGAMRVLLAAITCEKGDLDGNLVRHLRRSTRQLCGCDLAVFPEMSLTGSVDQVRASGASP